MEIGGVGVVVETPVIEVSTHQLIEQLREAVKNRQPNVDQLIGALQNRCLRAEEPLHPHINELVQVFILLSTRERPMERYHLAQVLALWVHKSALHQPVEFNRIPEGDWQRIRNMKGQHMLLDLYLDCLWGSYWHLCYPQDRPEWREKVKLFGKAAVCSYKAAKLDFEPSIEFATDLRGRIRQIPPDWTHKASLYLQWGHQPSRYKHLMIEFKQLVDERSKKDSPLLVAMAHALATVVARKDVDSISACEGLKVLACLGKKDKPRTNAFADVRYHAWSLLFSLGPQWNYTDELMKQRGRPEKVPEVLTLLTQEHSTFPCAPATTIAGDHFPPMNVAIIEESADLRTTLTRGLVEIQNGVIQILRNQQIIMVSLDEAKWERDELRRMIGQWTRLRPQAETFPPLHLISRSRLRMALSGKGWFLEVCGNVRQLSFNPRANYANIYEVCFKKTYEFSSTSGVLTRTLGLRGSIWLALPGAKDWLDFLRAPGSGSIYTLGAFLLMRPAALVLGLGGRDTYDYTQHLRNRGGTCTCRSCQSRRASDARKIIFPHHPELRRHLKEKHLI